MELQKEFIDRANEILIDVDFEKLTETTNGQDQTYAQEILKQLHQAFVDTYGTGCITDRDLGFIDVPAVIRGRKAGEVFLGLVTLDLEGSGEHWNTNFFMEEGVVDQSGIGEGSQGTADFLRRVGVYDYWYTPEIPGDIHVNFDSIPHKGETLLRSCTGITPTQDARVSQTMY